MGAAGIDWCIKLSRTSSFNLSVDSRLFKHVFFSTAKKICTKSFQKNLIFVVSQCLYNKQITSWLVRVYDFYSLVVENHKLTRSKTRSFVCDAPQLVNKNRTR